MAQLARNLKREAEAGAALAAQQTGCVLPTVDTAPPPPVVEGPGPTPGFSPAAWILAAVDAALLVAGIITLFDDNDNGGDELSPT
jgi:hypothetical protein